MTQSATPPLAAVEPRAPRSAWYALGVLTLVTLLAFVDRGVLVLQAEVIRKEFGLSDVQWGFLQGTAPAVLMALAAYPLGWLADRFDRRAVLAGCVLLWASAVVASGMAQSYEQLLLASALVAAGEAGLVPIVFALIPELFPPSRRQTANSIYTLASAVSTGLALGLTGQIVGVVEVVRPDLPPLLQTVDGWRLAMFAAAAPAPFMALLLGTIALRRAERGAEPAEAGGPAAQHTSALHTEPFLPYFKQHWRTFCAIFGGGALTGFGSAAVGTWLAVIYQRVYGQTAQQVGAVLGVIAVAGTAIGFLLSIWVIKRFSPTMGLRLNMRVMVMAALVLACSFAAMVFATRAEHMYAIQAVYITLVTVATMLAPSIMQTLAPGRLRARVVSIQSVIGAAAAASAPPVTGLVSDQLKHLPNGLILSSAIIAVPCLLVAAVLFFVGERLYEATALEAKRIDQEEDGATAPAPIPEPEGRGDLP